MNDALSHIRTERALASSLRAAARGLCDAASAHDKATGAALIAAKAGMKRGEWLPWLKSTGISERRAQQIMRVARKGG